MGGEWPKVAVESIGEVKSGKRLPKGDELTGIQTPYPYIRLVNIAEGRIRKKNLQYLKANTREKIQRYIVNHRDVGLAIVGHTIGMVFYVDDKFDGVNLTENAARITNISSEFNSKFLYYYLTSSEGQREIICRTVGSAQGKLPLYNIRSMEVPRPPLPEQKAIIHILGSLDDKIELNRQTNQTLEAMAQALFKSWFVDFDPVIDNALAAGNEIPETLQSKAAARQALGDKRRALPEDIRRLFPPSFVHAEKIGWIPKGWEPEKLNSLLEIKYGKDHKKLGEGEIPVYGSGGLMRKADQSLYKGESVLIPRKGTLSNILYVNEAFWTVDTMFYTIPKHPNIAKYAFYHLKSLDFISMNVGSAVPSMTTKVLNELPVILPDPETLEHFDYLLRNNFNKSLANLNQTLSLTKLRDTLLPELISGEIRIPDANKLVEDAGL